MSVQEEAISVDADIVANFSGLSVDSVWPPGDTMDGSLVVSNEVHFDADADEVPGVSAEPTVREVSIRAILRRDNGFFLMHAQNFWQCTHKLGQCVSLRQRRQRL